MNSLFVFQNIELKNLKLGNVTYIPADDAKSSKQILIC